MAAEQARGAVGDRRQLLIDTARRLFATRPYDQVTTTEIAKNAGVAYGLIAHHFGNKRGLYLAVMNQIAVEIATVQLDAAPDGAPRLDQLRCALRAHIAYIDTYADSFIALLRGALGTDAEHQSAIEHLRWMGAQRILLAIGITEPIPPVLRTAMHGWVGYLDEMILDRLNHHDVQPDSLIELAVTALATTLQTAAALDSAIAYPPSVTRAFKHLRIKVAGKR